MRILFLSPLVPYPPIDGDRQRAYHLLQQLAQAHTVHLLCFQHPAIERKLLHPLGQFCASVTTVELKPWHLPLQAAPAWFTHVPLNVGAYTSADMSRCVLSALLKHKIESVYAYRLRMVPYALLGEVAWRVLDYTDSLARYFQHRLQAPHPFWQHAYLKHEAQRLIAYEVWASRQFKVGLISSPRDQAFLYQQGARRNLQVISNGVDTATFKPGRTGPQPATIIFVANMRYWPNHTGLQSFCQKVWPRVKAHLPQAHLQVVGIPPSGHSRSWQHRFPGAEFKGVLPHLLPALQQAQVGICPVSLASGRQFKVIEYFAAGVPTVATSIVAKNLQAIHQKHLLVADTPELFAQYIIRLCQDQALAKRLRQAARQMALKQYDWSLAGQKLRSLYQKFLHTRRRDK